MTTLHATPGGTVAYAKGAPEVILNACTRVALDEGVAALDGGGMNSILQTARQMAEEALRVLAVAYKPNTQLQDAESDMIFLGLLA